MFDQINQALIESTTRVLTGLAHLLPGVVALIVAVLVSFGFATLSSWLLRRLLRGVDFDGKLASWGWAGLLDISPSQSPAMLVIGVIYWCIILLGALIGFAAINANVTEQLVTRLLVYLPDLVAAVLLILIGNVIARFLARGVLIGAVNVSLPHGRLLSLGVKWLVIVLSTAMALEHIGIGGGIVRLAFGILFGGIVFTLALAIGLGSKDLVSRSLENQSGPGREESRAEIHHL